MITEAAKLELMKAIAVELGDPWVVAEIQHVGWSRETLPVLTDGVVSLRWGYRRYGKGQCMVGWYPADAGQLYPYGNTDREKDSGFALTRPPKAIAKQLLRALVPTVRDATHTLNLYRHQQETMLVERNAFVEKLVPFGAPLDDGSVPERRNRYEAKFHVGGSPANVRVNHSGNGGSLFIENLTEMQILDALLAIEAGQTAAVVAALQLFPAQG